MFITQNALKKAASQAAFARDNLTFYDCEKETHCSKVCAVCDALIVYGEESSVSIDVLKHSSNSTLLSKKKLTFPDGMPQRTIEQIKKYYSLKCFNVKKNEYRFLKDLVLSPSSYALTSRKLDRVGCCKSCSSRLVCNVQKNSEAKLPLFAIANGLTLGPTPKELEDLNEVELALVSRGRIDKHVFSFQAGTHKSIQGWHTLFYSNLNAVSGVANWCRQNWDSENDDDDDDNDNDGDDDDDGEDENREHDGNPHRCKFPQICVVLAGPFTRAQKALVYRKTKVNWRKINIAMRWLKENNPLYSDVEVCEEGNVYEPYIVDHSEVAESGNCNVEKIFEVNAVFPDSNVPTATNGGCDNHEQLMDITLERLQQADGAKEVTLIGRPTRNILRDYQGCNLLLAFPLQFPYGIGATNSDGEYRSGNQYLRHLNLLCHPKFHKAEWVCIIHNMYQRQKMITASFLKVKEDAAESFTMIDIAEMEAAIDRRCDGTTGSAAADLYLQKMKAVTGSMSHSAESAKKARQNMFSMIAKFGLPSIMFTITPEDAVNFRIRILACGREGTKEPPPVDSPEDVLSEFVIDCGRIRMQYPGLCAFDFENVIAITIEHLLGWNRAKNENKPDEGLFGDLDAWSYAVEEQGRKTLHAHFLLWVRRWKELLDGLARADGGRLYFEDALCFYGSKIMSTAMHGADESEVVNSCESTCMSKNYGILHHDKCSHQDVRELRTKNGKSSLEKKNIVRCTLCGACATSEALALAKLRQWFGEAEPHVSIEGDYIWSSGSAMSRWQLKMEIEMLHAMVPPIDDKRSMDSVFTVSEKILFVCNALRNLHRSDHCKSCFKNGLECRMMVPSCACQQCEVMFNDENSNWYDWQGNNVPRPLFLFRPERSHGDMFVNVHNSMASVLFGCNTNVIAGVDGGSVMYCTCYISKNTQKEDSEHYGRAAKQMVKKMKASVENAEQQQSSSTAEGSVDKISVGMKGMIGGVFMASAALKTSAPLAAYLIRNGSRFHYSHRVGYVNINSYFSGLDNDISIDSTGEGKVFYKSQVANYLCRPNLLENVSLYDFVSDYSVCRPSATSMDWAEPHPSKNYLKVKKINVKRVPSINYLDFVDTKFFGGNNILTCGVPDDDKEEYQMMEEYARKVCALFLPFRHDANQLKVDGSFIKCLRKAFGDGTLKASHKDVLRNVQDCRNSLNVGRPMDYLERVTEKPNDCERGVGDVINGEADVDFDEMNDAVDELLNIAGTFGDDMNLRDASDRLRFASYMTRCHGTNQCGQNLVLCPKTPPNSVDVCKVDGVSHCRRTTNEINALYSNSVTKEALHELAVRVTTRVTDESGNVDVNVTGTLQNVRAYAEYHFLGDEDQKVAFESIVCAFILQLYREASKNRDVLQPRKMRKLNNVLKVIEKVNRDSQLIAFLSGAGGTGKSHVIKTVCRYAKKLCESLNVVYNKRTIVVTALTGAAAVSVNGETTHMACALARSVSHKEMDEFEHAYMLIVDEVSFASKEVMEKLDRKMRQIMEQPELRFGGIPLVFAGDFTQLRPVGSLPIYLFPDFEIWFDWVHTFIELKTNHRFENDPAYGRLLGRYRETGPTTADVQKINTRVVGSIGGPKESDIPNDAVYATKTNVDRMAINDAIFAKHLENTHFRNLNVLPPKHTVCIKATALKFKKRGRGNEYISMNKAGKDIMYAAVGEAHVEAPGHKFHDPLLKLYSGRPLMINRNEDVSACIANGAMCEFKGVDLKRGISYNDLEIIIIDGFFVWCACVSQIDALVVNMVDGNSSYPEEMIIYLKASVQYALVQFPILGMGPIHRNSLRIQRKMSLKVFPVNVGNARTVHKLQGRSITNLIVSSWDYRDNWIYVCLSRCCTMQGLFLRTPLNASKTRPMSVELQHFLHYFRTTKNPPRRVQIHREL